MFGKGWSLSERKYDITIEKELKIPMSDGVQLTGEGVFRPIGNEKFPAILSAHPYLPYQTSPIKPRAYSAISWPGPEEELTNGWLETGDPTFFARRGFAFVICNIRGTGKSGGTYSFLGQREIQDVYEAIEWVAKQPWCSGRVGTFGLSYAAWIQLFAASLNPPHLNCCFAPWASTDLYRDVYYHEGILSRTWSREWAKTSLSHVRLQESYASQELDERGFEAAIANALSDPDLSALPDLLEVLKNPRQGVNPFTLDIMLHPLDGPFWKMRAVRYDSIKVPIYLGGDWSSYGVHLRGAFRSWENLKVPKRMIVGPPAYVDRPVYQLHYEALRWFDHWLKGNDTGLMREPPIKLFVMNTGEWKDASEWPLPETRWTSFYLHEDGLLSEHEHWPDEQADVFEDSPWKRGYLSYYSPTLVENTEVIGPMKLKLYASTTDTDVFWFVSLRDVDNGGNERVLTRGWLRGSQRRVDPARSKPWEPFHPHDKRESLTPHEIYEFDISIVPTGNLFRAGSRIGLRIRGADDEAKHTLESIASGHVYRRSASRVVVYHDAKHPSHLLLPITKGNVIETFTSGGKPFM